MNVRFQPEQAQWLEPPGQLPQGLGGVSEVHVEQQAHFGPGPLAEGQELVGDPVEQHRIGIAAELQSWSEAWVGQGGAARPEHDGVGLQRLVSARAGLRAKPSDVIERTHRGAADGRLEQLGQCGAE